MCFPPFRPVREWGAARCGCTRVHSAAPACPCPGADPQFGGACLEQRSSHHDTALQFSRTWHPRQLPEIQVYNKQVINSTL